MLTKEKSNKTKLVKYIAVIPIVLSMLIYVSCTDALEIEKPSEEVANAESTVMEDVITIINRTAFIDNNNNNKDISEGQLDIIINDLKQYKAANNSKINKEELDEYSYMMFRNLDNISPEDYEGYMKKNLDLYYFHTSYMLLKNILDEIDTEANRENIKLVIKLLVKPKMINRLQELNYVLPNKEKYAKAIASIERKEVNEDYSGQAEVPFTVLEQSPIFPGCDENETLEELKKCFSKSIATHINENFNIDIVKTHNLKGKQKIFIAFKIDEEGKAKDLKARAPHEALKAEAIRVINTLPTLKPGMHNGKAVTVNYTIPVIFMVD